MKYPVTKKDSSVTDNYFGVEVSDPYRWLEDDNSTETSQWVDQQNLVTNQFLNTIPNRDKFQQKLTQLWDYTKFSNLIYNNSWYYYWKNEGLQNQPVLYRQSKLGDESTSEVLLDPNKLSEDGTCSVKAISISSDGQFLAYTLSSSGSDYVSIYFLNLLTKSETPDVLTNIKFTKLCWVGHDLIYSGFGVSEANVESSSLQPIDRESVTNHTVFLHKMGTPQVEDRLIYQDSHPNRLCYTQVTTDEKHLVVSVNESSSYNILKYLPLTGNLPNQIELLSIFDDKTYYSELIDSDESYLYFVTNYQASYKQLVRVPIDNPSFANLEIVIPQKDALLENVNLAGDCFFVVYLRDVVSVIEKYDINGDFIEIIPTPNLSSVLSTSGSRKHKEYFFKVASFLDPGSIYCYNLESQTVIPVFQTNTKFDPDKYVVDRIFYPSQDGTSIPMFIVKSKSTELNGKNPTLLYGYGGFNASITPVFSPSKIAFVELGGIFCVANIRGGSEYGESWHQAGCKLNKQNVFDDFIAGAEYLIQNNYTSSNHLAIQGGSNGGLLVAACMTQRPDLFKVCIPQVGVLDMLRYHKFTIGWAWSKDYGTSEESKEMFEYLYQYSPLHNCKPNQYPATLITTADHDDRVVPGHSFKFAATLQSAQLAKNPILIRVQTKAGHGAGVSTSQAIEENTDIIAFILHHTKS